MHLRKTTNILSKARKEKRKLLLETEAKAICAEYGIPVTRFELARTESEAVESARKIGYPVVLKIVSPDISHKSDVGGVLICLKSDEEVRDGYGTVLGNARKNAPQAKVEGVLVQEMAPPSTEVIVGAVRDPQFGPALMFGLGGVFVEVLKDVTFRIAPIGKDEAREMIAEVKAYPLLKGYRNTPPVDIDAIVDILLRTSQLVTENDEIKELDLNPIMVYRKGAKTIDARILLT